MDSKNDLIEIQELTEEKLNDEGFPATYEVVQNALDDQQTNGLIESGLQEGASFENIAESLVQAVKRQNLFYPDSRSDRI